MKTVAPITVGSGQQANAVSQYGITWTFDRSYQVGQFVTGDWWVVGPVKIIGISPGWDGSKNGSMLDPVISKPQGFDSRHLKIDYNASNNVGIGVSASTPLTISGTKSLVSVVSTDTLEDVSHQRFAKVYAVLTILPAAPTSGSFRPPLISGTKPIHNTGTLNFGSLGTLVAPSSAPSISSIVDLYAKPQVDFLEGWSVTQLWGQQNVPFDPSKGTKNSKIQSFDIARELGTAMLVCNLNHTAAAKAPLVHNLVQMGIDYYEHVSQGHRYSADGGNGYGRKAAVLFAGKLLNHAGMLGVGTSKGPNTWAEDCSTFYVPSSHVGKCGYTSGLVGQAEWGVRHCTQPSLDDASDTGKGFG